jgi:hypothetical protein
MMNDYPTRAENYCRSVMALISNEIAEIAESGIEYGRNFGISCGQLKRV